MGNDPRAKKSWRRLVVSKAWVVRLFRNEGKSGLVRVGVTQSFRTRVMGGIIEVLLAVAVVAFVVVDVAAAPVLVVRSGAGGIGSPPYLPTKCSSFSIAID